MKHVLLWQDGKQLASRFHEAVPSTQRAAGRRRAHLALLRQAQMLLRFCARHKMLAPGTGTSASALLRQAQNASALSC